MKTFPEKQRLINLFLEDMHYKEKNNTKEILQAFLTKNKEHWKGYFTQVNTKDLIKTFLPLIFF